ncbi:MAG: uroporphyrinogen decarboxylase family protein [Dehalococcoidales bacterium]
MVMSNALGTPATLPENWAQMTPAEKRKYRLDRYLSAEGIKFVNEEAKKAYKIRAQRIVDVYNVREPDRVPVSLPVGSLPFDLAGINAHTAMYDLEKAIRACMKFNEKYSAELEYFASPMSFPGNVMDMLDYKIYAWPGRGIPESAPGFQFIEGEYMKPEEYDDLIRDPSDFWLRTYLPRVFGVFEAFKMFQPLTAITENVHIPHFMPLALPRVQESLQKLIDVGKEYQRLAKIAMPFMGMGVAHGFPVVPSAFAKAPFDTLGDTLRGTKGIIQDMFRRPDKLLKALDVIADLSINEVLKSPSFGRLVIVHYPLHKGADGWMSEKQFDTFYWPSLKKMMDTFIKEGLIQSHFAEGSYNTRLEKVNGFEKGTVNWYFDRTDMFKAKKILGANCCIMGNVPASLVLTGSPEDVKEYCRKLIVECGKGGGFILAAGTVGTGPKIENLRAMMEAVREYGVYKK